MQLTLSVEIETKMAKLLNNELQNNIHIGNLNKAIKLQNNEH